MTFYSWNCQDLLDDFCNCSFDTLYSCSWKVLVWNLSYIGWIYHVSFPSMLLELKLSTFTFNSLIWISTMFLQESWGCQLQLCPYMPIVNNSKNTEFLPCHPQCTIHTTIIPRACWWALPWRFVLILIHRTLLSFFQINFQTCTISWNPSTLYFSILVP